MAGWTPVPEQSTPPKGWTPVDESPQQAAEPQAQGFLPSVAQFVEGKSPWFQDQDPFWARIKQSVAPANLASNLYQGAKGAIGTAVDIGKDLASNPNWAATMPAGQRPSTMQKYVTEPAKAEWAKGQEFQRQAESGDDQTRRRAGLEAVGHYGAALLPGVGPWAASLGEQAGSGDVGGAGAQVAGGYLGTKAMGKIGDVTKDSLASATQQFLRRVDPIQKIEAQATQVYQAKVQKPLLIARERMVQDGVKELAPALEADKQAGAPLLIPGEATASIAQALEATGYSPTPMEKSLLDKMSADPMDDMAKSLGYANSADALAKLGPGTWEQIKNAPVTAGAAKSAGMSLDDAIKLRSKIGSAAVRADRAGNAKGANVMWSAYNGLGDAMGAHIEKLTGSTKPFDNYNKNMSAAYEFDKGISGELTQPIKDNHEAIDKLKTLSKGNLDQVIDNYFKPKGMSGSDLIEAKKAARAMTDAHSAISGRMAKSAYRVILAGGVPAATAIAVYGAASGLGMHGMIPIAMMAYLGSKATGVSQERNAQRLFKQLNIPEGSYKNLRITAPPSPEAIAEPPTKAAQVQQVQQAKGTGPGIFRGAKGPTIVTPPAGESTPVSSGINTSNFPTPESRAASDQAFNMRYRKGEVPGKPMDPIQGKAWDESMERRSTPRVDTDALSQAYVKARAELPTADSKTIAKRAQQIAGITSGGDIGDKARQDNPEPSRASKAAKIKRAKESKP